MRALATVLLVLTCSAPAQEAGGVRFTYVDVYLDAAASSLAAYQVDVSCADPAVKLAGVEGGESKPFSAPPYHDPGALQGGRVVLGAFTVDDDAPVGRQRVARLHFQELVGRAPSFEARVVTAAAAGGGRIEVKIELVRNGGER